MKVGHRGARNLATENTLAAIEAGYRYADAVEIDLRLTKDGQLILHHDATLERIYGMNMRIADHTLTELQAFTFSHDHPIASIDEALEIIGSRPVFLELKDEGSADILARKLADFPACRPAGVISYKKSELHIFNQHKHQHPTYFIPNKRNFLFSVAIAKRINASGIVPHMGYLLSPPHFFWARKKQLQIMIYPVNSDRTAKLLRYFIPTVYLESDNPDRISSV